MFKKLGRATASKLLPTALVQHGFILHRWGLDRRAENPSKPGLPVMLLSIALLLSAVATPNLTLRTGE